MAQCLQNLDASEAFVIGFYQRPGGDFSTCAVHHIADSTLVILPFFAIVPVFGRDLEALEIRILPCLKSFQLLVLGDGQPELAEDEAVVHHLRFKIIDFRIAAHPVGFGTQSLDALDQHAAIPGAVEDREAPAAGNVPPESPQIRLSAFFLVGCRDGNHLVPTWIERARDSANAAALAGGVEPLERGEYP